MNYDEMVKWTFEAILSGLMRGHPLRSIAADIVLGLSNIIMQNNKKMGKK